MKHRKEKEIKVIFAGIALIFLTFLAVPMVQLLMKSFTTEGGGLTLQNFQSVFARKDFFEILRNSFGVAGLSAAVTTLLAFFLACTIHYTNIPDWIKTLIKGAAVLPMFLPTITYGFAIIYSFGKQGLLTRLFGKQLFEIYGIKGLLMGYVIYTLPISFMLINNTMGYIDKKYMIVSRVMGDSAFANFKMTVLRPLLGTLAASVIQSFFLSFTDFGIPAAVGGKFKTIASLLYSEMLGSIPNFQNGAVVAVVMLVPSVVSITVLKILEKYQIRYNKISKIELKKNRVRDGLCGGVSILLIVSVLSVFAVIFVIPFVEEWPYRLSFTLDNFRNVFEDPNLFNVYTNSLFVAAATRHHSRIWKRPGDSQKQDQSKGKRHHRRNCPGDEHDTRNGAGPRIFIPIFRHQSSKYIFADYHLQRGPLFFHALSDDEEFPGENERLMGDNSDAYGRQLGKNHFENCNAQRIEYDHRGIQLLLYQCHGDDQCGHLHRWGQDNGHHDEDQRTAVL